MVGNGGVWLGMMDNGWECWGMGWEWGDVKNEGENGGECWELWDVGWNRGEWFEWLGLISFCKHEEIHFFTHCFYSKPFLTPYCVSKHIKPRLNIFRNSI